jgi:glucose-6-phosphate isomerase
MGREPVDYETGTIIWENLELMHNMLLIHQGTKLIPSDFIGFVKPLWR